MKFQDVPLREEKGLSVGTRWAACGGPGWLWTSGQEDGCQTGQNSSLDSVGAPLCDLGSQSHLESKDYPMWVLNQLETSFVLCDSAFSFVSGTGHFWDPRLPRMGRK